MELGKAKIILFNIKYQFHDTRLSPIIENARHAIALDEKQPALKVCIMNPGEAFNGTLKQVWFPGNHGCVGGGTVETKGLSNGALKWIADEASQVGLYLDLDLAEDTQIIDSKTAFNFKSNFIFNLIGQTERNITQLNDELQHSFKFDLDNSFHASVKERWCDPDLKYRPQNLQEFIGDQPHNWC